MNNDSLSILIIAVFVLFIIYLIMKSINGRIQRKRKENSRFRF